MKTYSFGSRVLKVIWNPNPTFLFLVVSLKDGRILFVNPLVSTPEITEAADTLLLNKIDANRRGTTKLGVTWSRVTDQPLYDSGVRIQLVLNQLNGDHISWHHKGDYMSVVTRAGSTGKSGGVYILRISAKSVQKPFKKKNHLLHAAMFHPTLPQFFLATQLSIRIYDLVKQELIKKLKPSVDCISSFDIHPGGDNLIMGSTDRKVCWFDLDLSVRPYRILKYHKNVVRQTVFSKSHSLFATSSDDGTVHIFHGKVFSDLLKNAEIVPVYILRGHERVDDEGVLDCQFHPTQPWLFTAGADSKIFLYSSNN